MQLQWTQASEPVMGRQRQKVDINNAPLVDVTLVMRMPSDDVYLLQLLCSCSGLKQASRLWGDSGAEGGYK
jgi:hypothetical protein